MPTTSPIKKTKQISLTVTLDSELKHRAETFAEMNHIDFSTLLGLSLSRTIETMNPPAGPHYTASPEYIRELDEMMARIDRGEEEVFGPFEGKAAIEFLNQYI